MDHFGDIALFAPDPGQSASKSGGARPQEFKRGGPGCVGTGRWARGLPMMTLMIVTTWLGLLVLSLSSGCLAVRAVADGAPAMQLSSPLDHQVVQRRTRDEGMVHIVGRLAAPAEAGDVLEAQWTGDGVMPLWHILRVLGTGETQFNAEFPGTAGGWYRLSVRVRRGETLVAEEQVPQVGIGEVFLVAGQSNSANHGEERQRVTSGRVTTYTGVRWQSADDPQPGASGGGGSFVPPFADAMVRRFNVPVGIIAVGAGGTSIREWLPAGSRFANPPTVTGNVTRLDSGEWESNGTLFTPLVARMSAPGPGGIRAVLWHQGESDANQSDPTRTLPGDRYRDFLRQVIHDSRRAVGWEVPWFVAQVSYHTPDDPASLDIRAAQADLWRTGVALQGPDTDTLTGSLRDSGGQGVHFSGPGLREHARLWVGKVTPWLEEQLMPRTSGPAQRLDLSGLESFSIGGRPAFVFLPDVGRRTTPQPWIFYAPTLAGLPDAAEQWMHEQFLAAGVAVAGVDVGEAYGSPKSHAAFEALYRELIERRGFAPRPCLLGRSRGGLAVSSWAIAHPDRVSGIAGIYPVFDFRTYPGLTNAAPAYGLTPAELDARAPEFNPVERIEVLAAARMPVVLIHGDADVVVPLRQNSAEVLRRYRGAGADSLVKLIVLPGEGHDDNPAFFHSRELVDFAIERAKAGAGR